MTDAELAAIRERCEAATPGPWVYDAGDEWQPKFGPFDDTGAGIVSEDRMREIVIGGHQDEQGGAVGVILNRDAEFIAAARSDVPALLDEVERLRMDLGLFRSENDDLRVENERLRKVCQQLFALFPPGSPDAKARGCICQSLDREQNLPAYMHTRYHNCPLHGSIPLVILEEKGDA